MCTYCIDLYCVFLCHLSCDFSWIVALLSHVSRRLLPSHLSRVTSHPHSLVTSHVTACLSSLFSPRSCHLNWHHYNFSTFSSRPSIYVQTAHSSTDLSRPIRSSLSPVTSHAYVCCWLGSLGRSDSSYPQGKWQIQARSPPHHHYPPHNPPMHYHCRSYDRQSASYRLAAWSSPASTLHSYPPQLLLGHQRSSLGSSHLYHHHQPRPHSAGEGATTSSSDNMWLWRRKLVHALFIEIIHWSLQF